MQLGLGAIGAETLFQPSDGTGFYIDWSSLIKWPMPYRTSFFISVPAGTEFSVSVFNCSRWRSGAVHFNLSLELRRYAWPLLYPQEIFDFSSVTAFGLQKFSQSASSLLQWGNTPASIGVKSAYVPLFANTAFPVFAWNFIFFFSSSGNFQVDLAIGPGGGEVIIMPDFSGGQTGGSSMQTGPVYFPIAINTRVSFRAANVASGVGFSFSASMLLFG